MAPYQTTPEVDNAELLALRALATIVGNDTLGPRFLSLTGLTVENLRQDAGERHILLAVLDFLSANEADLVQCAQKLDIAPNQLTAARTILGGSYSDQYQT